MTFIGIFFVAAIVGVLLIVRSTSTSAKGEIVFDYGLHSISVVVILMTLTAEVLVFDASTYLGDLWTAFEAVNKTAGGQHSSVDYFSPIGPFQEWIYGVTLLVHSPSARSVLLANGFVAILSLACSVLLLRRHASPVAVAVVAFLAVTTALSPRDLDSLVPRNQSSFLAPYNRWAWSLLVPVVMRSCIPLVRRDFLGSILCGLVISALLLLKVTYGAAAIGLVGLATLVWRGRWFDTALTLAICFAGLTMLELSTQSQVRAYLLDLRTTAAIGSNVLRVDKLLQQLPELAVFLSASLALMWATAPSSPSANVRSTAVIDLFRSAFMVAATGTIGCTILMQNHYSSEAALYPLMPLLAAEATGILSRGQHGVGRERTGLVLIVLIGILYRPVIDAGFVVAQGIQNLRLERDAELRNGGLSDLIVHPRHRGVSGECDSTCIDYQRMLSGRDLLDRFCAERSEMETVAAANFSNPFPILRSRRSPPGSPIWFHADRSVSQDRHPAAATMLGSVRCVMEALDEGNSALFMVIYGDELRGRYHEAGRNDRWRIWVANE